MASENGAFHSWTNNRTELINGQFQSQSCDCCVLEALGSLSWKCVSLCGAEKQGQARQHGINRHVDMALPSHTSTAPEQQQQCARGATCACLAEHWERGLPGAQDEGGRIGTKKQCPFVRYGCWDFFLPFHAFYWKTGTVINSESILLYECNWFHKTLFFFKQL